MRIDNPAQVEGSVFVNLTVDSGTSFPGTPTTGELFYRTDLTALYINTDGTGGGWVSTGGGGGSLGSLSDVTLSSPSTGQVLYKSAGNWLNTGAINIDPAGTVILQNNGSEKLRTLATGAAITNGTFATPPTLNGTVPELTTQGSTGQASVDRYSVDAVGGTIAIRKSRNSAIGSQTVVQSGDALGTLSYYGSDGTNFQPAVQLSAFVDTTPGTTDMPGRLVFLTTPDGSATPLERMRLTSTGGLHITGGGLAYGTPLTTLDPQIAIQGGTSGSSMIIYRYHNNNNGPSLQMGLSRSTTIGGNTAVATGDTLAQIVFRGADGVSATNLAISSIITATADATPASNSAPGRLVFGTTAPAGTNTLERIRISSNGQVSILGNGASYNNAVPPKQVNATDVNLVVQSAGANTAQTIDQFTNDAVGSTLALRKSHTATLAAYTIVQSGDSLGNIEFYGSNGSTYTIAASITSAVDGTPGATNDMPGRLMFSTTPDGTGAVVERMRIANTGLITAYDVPSAALKNVKKTEGTIGDYEIQLFSAGQTVTASTTLVNATGLSSPTLALGGRYVMEGILSLTTTSTGGGKFQITSSSAFTTGAIMIEIQFGTTGATSSFNIVAPGTPVSVATAGATNIFVRIRSVFRCSLSVAPVIDVQFAQNSAAGDTVLNIGHMRYTRLS